MTFSLREAVASLANNVFDSAQAGVTALNGSNDLYHFQMAVKEYGERAVVEETSSLLQDRYECTYAEAASIAGQRVQAALELVAGQGTFKPVRDNLKAKQQKGEGPLPAAT